MRKEKTIRDRQLVELGRRTDCRRYEAIIDKYLADSYAQRTVARVSELAQLLDSARPYLSRIIPQLFGESLRAILRRKQIEEAKRLLTVTALGLDEIAAASAFGHRSTLFRVFRRLVGVTPGQYRK
ncbi:MAG TPA: AraC family transcriptional regulator [Thermoanaerobaculia bacterium]|nr:AraC family transcriptional regulator [Thermoanaerobaculia bacterium]